jgi:predicted TIM-barrel fold metal-dependent hydrolase
MRKVHTGIGIATIVTGLVLLIATGAGTPAGSPFGTRRTMYVANDSHFHLTNYIQEGPALETIPALMGDQIGRAALFGIPLQQSWSYRLSADHAPSYYLDSDADLYYYSFTDAYIAMAYRGLPKAMQARFDPMITGFNPADMYAADHVRRVLQTFPGVFVGIGEFSIHKEFVTSKVSGEPPSIADPALDRLFDFAGEVGLVVLVHCDADVPFPKPGAEPMYFKAVLDELRAHPSTKFIWAHIGLGRVIRPFADMRQMIEEMLDDPSLRHVSFDLSWSETAKYLSATPDTARAVATIIERHPDRFLFGTDEVGPKTQQDYLRVLRMYDPLWALLSPDVRDAVRKHNYERLFDEARVKVRAWEAAHRKASL